MEEKDDKAFGWLFDLRCHCGHIRTIRTPPWDSNIVLFDCKRCGLIFEAHFGWPPRGGGRRTVPLRWDPVPARGPLTLAGALHDMEAWVSPSAVHVTMTRASDARVEWAGTWLAHRVRDNLPAWYRGWAGTSQKDTKRRVSGRPLEAFLASLTPPESNIIERRAITSAG